MQFADSTRCCESFKYPGNLATVAAKQQREGVRVKDESEDLPGVNSFNSPGKEKRSAVKFINVVPAKK